MDYAKLIQDEIKAHQNSPIKMLGDSSGGAKYMDQNKDSYIRTVRDISNLWKDRQKNRKILEIGSFLGVVSIALKKMGYDVFAADIPEYYQLPHLRSLYERNGIQFSGINLRNHQLPYENECFDAVILCEVIEHLNFNPLPVLREINRVVKKDGFIYIGMPNQSHIIKRLQLLRGKSIHNPIDHYFKQLDRNDNVIVGLHWREYTLSETIQMIEAMGFHAVNSYYCKNLSRATEPNLVKMLIKFLLYMIPSFRPSQVVVGRKTSEPTYDFWLTDANS